MYSFIYKYIYVYIYTSESATSVYCCVTRVIEGMPYVDIDLYTY